jgi:hypothetical protein
LIRTETTLSVVNWIYGEEEGWWPCLLVIGRTPLVSHFAG